MKIRQITLLLVATIFTGCVTTSIPLEKDFIAKKSPTIAVAASEHPSAGFYKFGAQGLLDMAISETLNDALIKVLEQTKLSADFKGSLAKNFKLALAGESRTILEIDTTAIKELPKFANAKKKVMKRSSNSRSGRNPVSIEDTYIYSKQDYRTFGDQGIDYLLIITPLRYGLERSYYGFIPLGAPKGHSSVKFDLIESKSNRVIWRETAEIRTEISGEWDNPPEFKESKQAIKASYQQAMKVLINKIKKTI